MTGQVLLGGKTVAWGLGSSFVAGFTDFEFVARRGAAATLRRAAAAHRRVVVRMTVHDWAGNKRTLQRAVHLSL